MPDIIEDMEPKAGHQSLLSVLRVSSDM